MREWLSKNKSVLPKHREVFQELMSQNSILANSFSFIRSFFVKCSTAYYVIILNPTNTCIIEARLSKTACSMMMLWNWKTSVSVTHMKQISENCTFLAVLKQGSGVRISLIFLTFRVWFPKNLHWMILKCDLI